MLRVDLKIDPKVVETYYGKVETGLRGAGFVRTRPDAKWPAELQVKLPPAPVAQEPTSAPAPIAEEAAPSSAPMDGASAPSAPAAAPRSAAAPSPVAEASRSEQATQAPAPASAPASAPRSGGSRAGPAPARAPSCAFGRDVEVFHGSAREAKLAPPSPPILAPPLGAGPAHAPDRAGLHVRGARAGAAVEVAPESLAQLAGAPGLRSATDCNKLFQRRGSACGLPAACGSICAGRDYRIAADSPADQHLPVRARVPRRRRAQGKRRVSRIRSATRHKLYT